jgi:hypothetical protein
VVETSSRNGSAVVHRGSARSARIDDAADGLVIAVAHVLNRGFVAPVYDVVLNLIAFACAVGASLLLGHRTPAALSAIAILCWLLLARRTYVVRRALMASGWDAGDET